MNPTDHSVRTALLVALSLATVAALILGASTSSAGFGPFNTRWNGGSQLTAEADALGVTSARITDVERYETAVPGETVAIVLSPDQPYSTAEKATVRDFVRNGGTLVVAEDFQPYSNDLLAGVGADARIDGRLLRDEYSYFRSPALPVATNVTGPERVNGVESITLNYPSFVQSNGASILISSSEFSYVDTNQNGKLDSGETVQSYPVVTAESIGDGQVIVVSDPSALVNVMLEQPGNTAFVHSLYAGHSVGLLDYSHAERLPPLAAAVLVLRDTWSLQIAVGALGIGLYVAWPGLRTLHKGLANRRRRGEPSTWMVSRDRLVAYVLDKHPEWEENSVRRMITVLRRPDDDPPDRE